MERVVIGGWPGLIGVGEAEARAWPGDYVQHISEVDVPAMGPQRNPRNVRRLLESLARSVGQPAKRTELEQDVGGDRGPVAPETLHNYLDALERLILTEASEAWRPHMRSRTRLRSAPVRYFVDPSLGPAALGIGSAELLADLEAAVFHFEAMVIRDLGSTHNHSEASSSPGATPTAARWTPSSRCPEDGGRPSRSSSTPRRQTSLPPPC